MQKPHDGAAAVADDIDHEAVDASVDAAADVVDDEDNNKHDVC